MKTESNSNSNDECFAVLKNGIRERLLAYTRRAYRLIPPIVKPRILDAGCGSGIPTLELARMSRGEITAIDINQQALDQLKIKAIESGISNQITVLNRSLTDMDFPAETFDIVWAEGSIYSIGFEKGIREWKRFLKPGGFMVIHDEQGNIEEKLEQIRENGYDLVDYFLLSKDIWWKEYFAPLQDLIDKAKTTCYGDLKFLAEIQQAQEELDIYRKYPDRNSSVYFIMKNPIMA